MLTVIALVGVLFGTASGAASKWQRSGDVWEVVGRTYSLQISAKDGSILSLSQSGRQGTILRSGEDGLWRVRFNDGSELNARSVSDVKVEQIAENALRLTYSHAQIIVAITITARDESVDFDAELAPKGKHLLDFVLPARLRFAPKQTQRLIFPIGGNDSVGVAFLRPFFEAQPPDKPARWERKTFGSKGFISVFGSPLQMLSDNRLTNLRVTNEGQKWLNSEAQKLASQRQVVVNRPPQRVGDLLVLVEATDGRPFFAGKFIGKGSFWLMGGRCGRPEQAPLQLSLVESVLQRVLPQNRRIGLIALHNEPAQGGWSAVSVQGWRERLGRVGEVLELRNGGEILNALKQNAVAAVVNPYTERLLLPSAEGYDVVIEAIRNYVQGGGHWFEVGGYPFFYGLLPSPYYRIFGEYPGEAFADFLHIDTFAGSASVYRIQRRVWKPWAGQTDKRAIFVPGGLACGADEKGGYFERRFSTFVEAGKSWKALTVRVQIGSSPEDALRIYGELNGIRRKLAEKMPSELLAKFKQAVLVRLHTSGQKQVHQQIAVLDLLPVPSIIHFTEYLPLGFDRPYPIHFPPNENYGTAEEFAEFLRLARGRGHLVMPYTNPTWFPDESPIWQLEGDKAKEALSRNLRGDFYRETYSGGAASGYSICFWHPLVQRYNRETVRIFTEVLPVDILFQDQCGARKWRYDTNSASPTPYAYTEGILSMVAEDSQKAPLSTEGGWDQVAEYQVQLCGLSFGIVPTMPRLPGHRLLKESFSPNTWRVFPVAQVLVHDKVAMLMHNLGQGVTDRRILAWVLGLGYGLQFRVSATALMQDERVREWLKWLSVLQKSVCARYLGEPLVAFEHEREDEKASWDDDGVIRAIYGSVRIVANLNSKALRESGRVISPYGFYATAHNVIAANLQSVGDFDFGDEGISFVVERNGGQTHIWVYALAGQRVAVEWQGKAGKVRMIWDDGSETMGEVLNGSLVFQVPSKPAGNIKRVWHCVVK